MDGTARLVRHGSSHVHVISSLFGSFAAFTLAAFGCGGGADASPPPTTPAQKTDVPPVTSDTTAPADTSATAAAAAAINDGSWPFVSVFSNEDRDAQLERLKKDPGPLKSNWVPPGKSDRYGHAEGLISAPMDAVRAKLRDFTSYKDLAGPKFKSVRVVDKQGQNTDVYFQLPIMKGMVTIWYVTRFPPARPAGGGDVLEGTFVKGNIKSMHIAFTVRPGTEEKNSVLVCDLILRPNVPAPQSALDEELRDACGDAINSLRKTIAANP
jgi:hypothetical protein